MACSCKAYGRIQKEPDSWICAKKLLGRMGLIFVSVLLRGYACLPAEAFAKIAVVLKTNVIRTFGNSTAVLPQKQLSQTNTFFGNIISDRKAGFFAKFAGKICFGHMQLLRYI